MALKELYREEVIPAMMKAFGYKNHMQVPKVQKITINMGVGEATQNADALEAAAADLAKISGQKPVITKAKRSISAFKAADLASKLRQAGATVEVVMTPAATQFVTPLTFQSLTGRPVVVDMFAAAEAEAHVEVARRADVFVIAPATADYLPLLDRSARASVAGGAIYDAAIGAAAVAAGAELLLTFNVRHFERLGLGIEVREPRV